MLKITGSSSKTGNFDTVERVIDIDPCHGPFELNRDVLWERYCEVLAQLEEEMRSMDNVA